MRTLLTMGAALLLGACSSNNSPPPQSASQEVILPSLMSATAWTIGPINGGVNYSHNVPLHPSQNADGSWSFDFPVNQDGVHYVTTHTSLVGKTAIGMKFHVDSPQGGEIIGANCPAAVPSSVTLYIQRAGDNWSGTGKYETYRWWFTKGSLSLANTAGGVQLTAPLAGPGWTAVMTSTFETNPQGFFSARDNADIVGFTFANCTGYGHGAEATAPITFTVDDFWVQ